MEAYYVLGITLCYDVGDCAVTNPIYVGALSEIVDDNFAGAFFPPQQQGSGTARSSCDKQKVTSFHQHTVVDCIGPHDGLRRVKSLVRNI